MTLEEKYLNSSEPLPRKLMPIILEDGTIINREEEIKEPEEDDAELQFRAPDDAKEPLIDFSDSDAIRLKIATLCETIMTNPEDKSAINGLFRIVDAFDT